MRRWFLKPKPPTNHTNYHEERWATDKHGRFTDKKKLLLYGMDVFFHHSSVIIHHSI
ncbi:MAG: hypothetical protein NT166_25215 [Candidatus Aminicenantes bacterium]|nr:hypothetical protein [Candidatus Aminicenantes bacterium]